MDASAVYPVDTHTKFAVSAAESMTLVFHYPELIMIHAR